MSTPTEAKQLLLHQKPTLLPDPSLGSSTSTFRLSTKQLPSPLPSGSVLLATRYLSNDPAQRGWISATIPAERLYIAPVEQDAPMRSRNIFEVLASESPSVKKGALVTVNDRGNDQIGWVTHAVVEADKCQVLAPLPNNLSPTHYLGALGSTGLTAYYGLTEIAQAKADDVVLVSGAAGATGSLAVQIAKNIIGCKRVLGIAGGSKKCEWVRSLGADACVDYKTDSFQKDLREVTEGDDQPTVYFDNVGGHILDFALTRLRRYGRIAACGAITAYNSEGESQPFYNWFEVISNRLTIRGFIVFDFAHRAEEVHRILHKGIEDGKIQLNEDGETVIEASFEDVPKTWMKLFEGRNQGKLVTALR